MVGYDVSWLKQVWGQHVAIQVDHDWQCTIVNGYDISWLKQVWGQHLIIVIGNTMIEVQSSK